MRRSARPRNKSAEFAQAQLGQIPLVALRHAVVVSDILNFRHAARVLGVTQSSVSARIKALEEALGIVLFERRHRGLPKPGLLDELNRLAFQYRRASRAILRDKTDAVRLLTKIRRQWFAKRKSIAAILKEVMTNEQCVPARTSPRRFCQRRQFRPPPQDPHALRIHLQTLDFRTRTIHPQSNPSDAGTEHLGSPDKLSRLFSDGDRYRVSIARSNRWHH